MKPKVLIVDGHSIIFRWEELHRLHTRRTESARLTLIERCSRHGDSTGVHVVIVFDGRGRLPAQDPTETRVQVFYSGSGQTADDVIERLVAKYADTHDITVATDDHLERTTVSTFGAAWISSARLLDDMRISEAGMRETIERLRKAKLPRQPIDDPGRSMSF